MVETCVHVKANGERCGTSFGLQPDGKCTAHSSHTAARMREARKRGGRASMARHRPGLSDEDLPALHTHEDAETALEAIARAVLTGKLEKGDAAAATRALEVWLKARADRLSGQHIDELERVLREKERELDELRRELARRDLRAV